MDQQIIINTPDTTSEASTDLAPKMSDHDSGIDIRDPVVASTGKKVCFNFLEYILKCFVIMFFFVLMISCTLMLILF